MLPFNFIWLEHNERPKFRERFNTSKRIKGNALTSLAKSRVISVSWLAPFRARFFLANGTFVALDLSRNLNLSNVNSVISSASYDFILCKQLEYACHEATDALMSNDFALVVSGTTNQSKNVVSSASNSSEQSDHNLYFIYFGRRHVGSGCEQLSQLDPHVQILPIGSSNSSLLSSSTHQPLRRERKHLHTAGFSVKPERSDRLRLIMNAAQDLFAVWWMSQSDQLATAADSVGTNSDGQPLARVRPGGVLIFRLNAASCNLNPLAALTPASGQQFLLLSFSHTAACEIFAIEWSRKEQHQIWYLVLAITTYLIDQDELVRLDSAPLSIPDKNRQLTPSIAALSPRDDRLLVAMLNGHLFLINVRSNIVASSTARFNVGIASVSWHPTGCLFAVVDVTGKLYILDLGLSTLHLFQLRGDNIASSLITSNFFSLGDFDALSKSAALNPPILSWNPDGSSSGHKLDKISQSLVPDMNLCNANNGTLIAAWPGLRGMGLFKLMLPHPPTSSYIIRHWLSLARSGNYHPTTLRGKKGADPALNAAVSIVSALDFDIDGEQAVRCVSSTATALLRQRPMDAVIDALLDKCLACFCNPIAPISDVTKLEFGPSISQILRRRALHLLRHGKLETAFDVAANKLPKPATDLLADTFYAALERGELALAKAAYARARRQVAVASAAIEVPPLPGQEKRLSVDDEEEIHSF